MVKVIVNGKIVMEEKILEDHMVIIEDGIIMQMKQDDGNYPPQAQVIDALGGYILPGFIDIHSDMIEQMIQPRSTALMDFELAMKEAEKQLALCGITTMYHSISMYREGSWDVKEIRKAKQVKKLAHLVQNMKHQDHLIHHRYHLRYEIDNQECYDDVTQMIKDGLVDMISFMDHSPGQGQYHNLDIYKKHLPNGGKGLTKEEFAELIDHEKSKDLLCEEALFEMAKLAKEKKIAIASHDDDTVEKLQVNQALGVVISEFPITMEVARRAKEMGFMTEMGAPNVLLGGSHSGNLSAEEAIDHGHVDILCSDYYPQSLLHAVFHLSKKRGKPLFDMVKLVSLNPAKAVGIDKICGSIAVGKKADFLIVSEESGYPVVQKTFLNGKQKMALSYSH